MRRFVFALLGLLMVAPVLWAALRHVRAEGALSLLREACSAHERVSYSGEAAWRRLRWHRPVRIRHDAESGRTRYAWGRRWSFVTSDPSERMPDPSGWCMDLEALEEGYRAEERKATRYLDRPARLLALKPRNRGRPTIHLTVDEETRLPLQVVVFRSDGSLYRVAAFREIEIGPQEVAPQRRRGWGWGGTPVSPEGLDEAAGYAVFEPDYLPEGFRLVHSRVTGHTVRKVRSLYSDGATAFEITQQRVPTPGELETEWSRRMSPERVERSMRRYLDRRGRALARDGAASDRGGIPVRCRDWFMHRKYELRVGRIEVELIARTDLDGEEPVRVLRSLRAK
jgi:hypothetical protein